MKEEESELTKMSYLPMFVAQNFAIILGNYVHAHGIISYPELG